MPKQRQEQDVNFGHEVRETDVNWFLDRAIIEIDKFFELADQFSLDFLDSTGDVDDFGRWMHRVRESFDNLLKIENFGENEFNRCVHSINRNLYALHRDLRDISKKEIRSYSRVKVSNNLDAVEVVLTELNSSTRLHRMAVAQRLEPHLNEYLKTLPSETIEDKKNICAKVEQILEPLGLAVEIPREPFLPGKLKATTGAWPGEGRFHFEVMANGKQNRLASSDTLPILKLIDSYRAPAVENAPESAGESSKWENKIGAKSTRKGRSAE